MRPSLKPALFAIRCMALFALAGFVPFQMSGCVIEPKKDVYELPDSYREAMDEARARVLTIDRMVIGARYDLAKNEAWILENVTKKLHNFEPAYRIESPEQYNEYIAKVDDLYNTARWLHYFVERHTKADALEQIDDYIERYNRLAGEFGPGGARVEAPRRPESAYAMPESYRAVVPGERIYR